MQLAAAKFWNLQGASHSRIGNYGSWSIVRCVELSRERPALKAKVQAGKRRTICRRKDKMELLVFLSIEGFYRHCESFRRCSTSRTVDIETQATNYG